MRGVFFTLDRIIFDCYNILIIKITEITMKKLMILLFLISSLFVNLSAKERDTLISNKDILGFMQEQKVQNTDIVEEAKDVIFKYYNKQTFEEPEWIRVKNFLTWLDKNKDTLNKSFKDRKLDLSPKNRLVYIGAFLGANYITEEMINKFFNLKITIGNTCESFEDGHMCISVDNFIDGVNSGMHEAMHLLPLVQSKYANGSIAVSMYNEELPLLSNLKYGLPKKVGSNADVREGTRAYFTFADDNFVEKNYKNILMEYAEVAYSAQHFSEYSKKNIKVYAPDYGRSDAVFWVLHELLNYNFYGEDEYEIEEVYLLFLNNKIYKDTVAEVIQTVINPKIKGKDKLSIDFTKLISKEENKLPMARIFVKNLKKYSDKNIPPVPNGYI